MTKKWMVVYENRNGMLDESVFETETNIKDAIDFLVDNRDISVDGVVSIREINRKLGEVV